MTPDWIEVNGVSLRYELAGAGPATLVLVHELGGCLDSWEETLPAFGRHFRTLRYDQRGFGHSEKVRGTIALDDMVIDLASMLDRLGIAGPVHLAGSALGAGIAAAFAARHPARMGKLVLQSLVTQTDPQWRQTMEVRAATVERDGLRPQAQASLDRSYPAIVRGNRERFERYRQRWIANDPLSFAAINRMLLGMDLAVELPGIACPTLSIGCEHDVLRPPAMVREVTALIPGARYVDADSGHFMAVQTPDLFTDLVIPFLLA